MFLSRLAVAIGDDSGVMPLNGSNPCWVAWKAIVILGVGYEVSVGSEPQVVN